MAYTVDFYKNKIDGIKKSSLSSEDKTTAINIYESIINTIISRKDALDRSNQLRLATSPKQTAQIILEQSINNYLDSIDTKLTGQATSVNQDTGNTFLESIDDKIVENQPDLWQILTMEGKGFIAATGFTTIAGMTEVDFMLIRNPVSSGVLVRFKEFLFTIKANSGQSSLIRFYVAPTITSEGTPLTIRKVLSTGVNNSQILAYQQPTISNRGTFAQVFNIGIETYQREQGLARYLAEGMDVLITVQGVIANIEHNISTSWAEEPLIV